MLSFSLVAEALTIALQAKIPTFEHSLPDDGRSISRNVANINKLVQDKIKLFFQNILQHSLLIVYSGAKLIFLYSTCRAGVFSLNSKEISVNFNTCSNIRTLE